MSDKDPSDNIWSRIIGYILLFIYSTTPKKKPEPKEDK